MSCAALLNREPRSRIAPWHFATLSRRGDAHEVLIRCSLSAGHHAAGWSTQDTLTPEEITALGIRYHATAEGPAREELLLRILKSFHNYITKYADMIRKQLRVDTIDLLQFHVWDDSWTNEPEFRSTVEKLKHDGWIKYFGLSLNRWQPENGIKTLHTGLVDCVQVIYNVFDQAPEDELFPVCQVLNIGVIARVPLDEGSLGGKMTLESHFPKDDWRSGYFGPENLAKTLKRIDKLKEIVPPGMSLPEMSLRFILSHPAVSTIIVGMRKPDHVRQNVAVSDAGPLDAPLLAELKKHRWDRTPQRWSD